MDELSGLSGLAEVLITFWSYLVIYLIWAGIWIVLPFLLILMVGYSLRWTKNPTHKSGL